MKRLRHVVFAALCCSALGAAFNTKAVENTPIRWEDTGAPQGVYFYWYEPSFYTGFAPRTQEPERVHLRLGRGNQVRLTVVLGPAQIDSYLEDLALRRQLVQDMITKKVLVLTTNVEWEDFVKKLDEQGVAKLVAAKATLGEEAYRQKSLEVMQALNPGRIFHIQMPVDAMFKRWKDLLMTKTAPQWTDAEMKLDVFNELLPGRINLAKVPPELDEMLPKILELAAASDKEPELMGSFNEAVYAFFDKATRGFYPVKDGNVDVYEFTAIYPAGTEQDFTKYNGKKIPDFGVTGVWPLIKRSEGRGAVGMVDYLSTNPAYGFITMLPYEHASGIVYNAFHNAGVRCPLGGTSFLPRAWLKAPGKRDKSKNYQTLWLGSRGPVSHGCTRLPSGHMSELRHVLPSDSDKLDGMPTYRNLPHTYDVFDIDGNGTPEVMGIKYYLAFSTTQDRLPHKAWAPNRREPFYEWLYTGELSYREDKSGYFEQAPSCKFVGRRAEPGPVYKDVNLYEADYEHERIQFYKLIPASFDSGRGFEFNRELRRLAVGYSASLKKLFLSK